MGDTDITGKIQVPKTANWDTYTQVTGETTIALPAGTYQLRLAIENANCNIDKITFATEKTGFNSWESARFDGVYEVLSATGISWGNVEISNGDISLLTGNYPKGIYLLRKLDDSGEVRRIEIR
jgi:hypothetical protein